MSGRVALHESITRRARREADKGRSLRRGNVTQLKPLTLQLHSYGVALTEGEDFSLGAWMKFYDAVVGLRANDLVVVQQEGSDWILLDVVSDQDVVAKLRNWRDA